VAGRLSAISRLRPAVLAPAIAALAISGAFALRSQFTDVIIAIAFGLLGFLGVRMLWEAFSTDDDESDAENNSSRSYWMVLFIAAIATSIDAAAAGLTLDLFSTPVWLSCLVIGLVTTVLCVPAYWFAAKIGSRIGHFAEAAGGVVLIGLGAKILLEHLT